MIWLRVANCPAGPIRPNPSEAMESRSLMAAGSRLRFPYAARSTIR